MSAYRRKRRRYKERYTYEERIRYWDEKALAEPDKLPTNYNYHVPDVPKQQGGPNLNDFGLTESISEIVTYYHDRNSKKPSCFDSGIGESFKSLISSAIYTAVTLGVLAAIANSSRKPAPALEMLAYVVVGIGGITCLFWLLALTVIPIKVAINRLRFARLSPESGPSPLLNGKTLIEAEKALKNWAIAVEANKAEYTRKCEARTAEIWRRHRLRIQRLLTKREFEKLRQEDQSKADQFEEENFAKLAMHPGYWTAGSAAEKGAHLEQKFGRLLKAAGYSVRFTPTSGDDGIDIIAHKDGQHVLVQCKNYSGKVGGPVG